MGSQLMLDSRCLAIEVVVVLDKKSMAAIQASALSH